MSWKPALRIVSGGQTGADRGALDAALALGLECGGWCPRGRRAEDGRISDLYPLRETESDEYPVRTEANVRDSDATLVLHAGRRDTGTRLTERLARRHARPLLVLDVRSAGAEVLRQWLADRAVRVLNVAGPRESRVPGMRSWTEAFLREALGHAPGDRRV